MLGLPRMVRGVVRPGHGVPTRLGPLIEAVRSPLTKQSPFIKLYSQRNGHLSLEAQPESHLGWRLRVKLFNKC